MITLIVEHEGIRKGYVAVYPHGKCVCEIRARWKDGSIDTVSLPDVYESVDEAIKAVIAAHDNVLEGVSA